MPCFVGVSNRTPHSWKTPVTNCRTWARSCSSVTGCPRISKNCWFALSKHRRSSSRTNEGVRSASETLGAVYVSRIWSSPEVPVDNGVILEVEAFDRRSSGTTSSDSDPKARDFIPAQDLNSHPATFVSRGERYTMEPIEGYIKILGFNLFYRIYGKPTKGRTGWQSLSQR